MSIRTLSAARSAQIVLLAIASWHAWQALTAELLNDFHIGVASMAGLLALVVLFLPAAPPQGARANVATPERRRRGRLMALAGGASAALWVAVGPWEPAIDFDVTGLLFLMSNLPQLLVLGASIVVATVGASMWWGR